MRKIYLLLIAALLLLSNTGFGQCLTAGNGQWPTATYVPTCTGSPEVITTVGFAGEYSVVTVTNGVSYTFTSSIVTDYITIGNTAGTISYAFGTTPVVWTATFSGDIRFYTHVNAACVENTTSRTRSVQCSPPPACVAPANSPTGLVLTPFSASQINGSFTAAAGAPSGYLIVRYPAGSATTNPVNGTTYATGNSLGAGKVVASAAGTTFSAVGLAPVTSYDFYAYSYNNTACTGGPVYKVTAPLSGTATSLSCAGLAAGTYTVGPTGTYASLTAVATALAGGTTGPVIFELQSTYLSSVETFPITFTGGACTITGGAIIRPQTGAAGLSITSANATGTILFDGGSNITIDGRAGGVGASQLTLSNTNVTGYTVQLINSARFNTFKYCTISGVNTGATSGVFVFNNAVGLATGNSNNTIDNCDIRDGATNPQNLIYASGNITDYASGNNNNTISNCLLHDWFNATSTTASAAIRLFQGGSDWTITGNSFYQSATRTFTMTTATDQSAVNITSAAFGTNFNISNNFIGGSAPLCGGTAWTYTATTGTPTAKMISLTAAPGPILNTISGNTLQNIAITSATTNNLSGLISHVSGNANITNNTLGSQTATGNVTFTLTNTTAGVFYLPIGFGLGASPCNVNVTNNNIGGITVTNSSTGSVSFRVIYSQAVAGSQLNVSNNLVGGTVANSLQQLSNNIFHGILILNPTVGGIYSNNTVRNLTLNNTGVTGSVVGVNIQASGGGHSITGNTVSNLTTNATNIAINNAASVVGISMTGTVVGGTNVSGNTIFNLTNTNTTVAGWINGMSFATAVLPNAPTIASKNLIHSINLASATGGMAGIISLSTGTAPFQVFNNMIRLGIDASGASITTPLQINGILKANIALHAYNNTVYIGGTGVTGGAINTFAYRRTSSGTIDTVMNNIFYNTRSNGAGTGKHYGIALNATTAINSNYNDILANGTGGVFGLNNVTDVATLAAWRTATNLDWNSVSADPILVNPTGTAATVDLHIGASATPVEQAGYNLANVIDDYDAQARAGLTPVDLGADAGNFTVSDIAPPVIYLTPLINTCSTADRAVNGINITDATGVPTSGVLRPRIYYRKNAGAWFSQPGTLASGTATNGIWNFSIVAADMGGLVATDVVSYYIIAQDIVGTPNIASNFGGAVATDVNTVTTQPTTPNTYTINSASLSGTYTVGAGGAYTTLTAAVAAYNSACLTGPVLFSLTDAAYAGETFPITINANPYASSVNTLTIKPTLAGTAITGSAATALIVLNGADWVTVNGSISATANTVCPAVAASRDLTLTNSNTSTTSAVIWLQSTAAFDGATNNKIINTNLVGNLNTQTFAGVGSGSTTISTASLGVGNHNNSFINNNISKTQYGIFSQGQSIGGKNNGTVINQNLINTVAPNNTARGGILVGFENAISISGNNISEIALTSSPDVFGIAMGGIAISTSTFTGNEVTNATVTKNVIGSVRNTGTFSAAGIFVAPALSGTNLIANNTLSGVSANGTSGDFSVGMLIGGGTGTTQIYYNTITMTSVPANTGASDKSYALAIGGFNPIVDVRNNILVNTQNNGTGNNYAICYGYTPFNNLTSSNNDYYTAAGATFFIGATGSLSAPTNQLTIANLQSVTAKDGAAQNVLPTFISATDLHLSTAAGNNWCLNNKGVAVSVTDDIDCQVRNNPPDIGADEFTATATDIATPASQTICSAIPITTIVLSGGAASYTWTRDNVATVTGIAASGTGNISGTLTNTTSLPVTVTFTITPQDAAACAGPSFTATVTVNPTNTITLTSAPGTNAQTVCINTPITNITYATTTATGATFSGLPAGVTGAWAANVVTISGTPTTSVGSPFSYTVTLTGGGSCGTLTANGTITVTPNNTITLTSAAGTNAQSVCLNSPITNITYSTTGATGATFSGLPAGVTGAWAANVATISGTPTTTVGSPFNYTVTLTGGCGTITANGTITVKPLPVIGSSQVEPTTCVSADGSITLTMSGAAGPYTFAWIGSGVNPTSQNQTGLTVGAYAVTVTAANGCTATANFALSGPGGCSICPTIPTFATNPAGAACAGSNVTFTASGLTNMGITYGIIFKYSAAPLANPYVGGTVIATVTNGGLTSGGTVATANSAAIPAGNYTVYAVLTPTPIDPACRPAGQVALTIGTVPDVNQPASQTICNNTATAAVNFTGSVPGTVFNWTNNTTSIGLGASGTGNIASFTGTNATNAAVTATVTVTPSYTSSGAATAVTMPAQNSTFSPNVRGYWFTAPVNFVITSLFVPTDASGANQSIAVLKFNGNTPPPVFAGTTNAFSTLFLTQNDATPGNIAVNIPISAGEVIGILGSRGDVNSYGDGSGGITIAGNPVATTRMGMQLPMSTNVPQNIWQEPSNTSISRVIFQYTSAAPITCQGTPKTFTITVNPTPVVNAVASQTVCNGTLTAPVNFSSPTTGPTGAVSFNWTNSNTAIGLGASGTGNIPAFTGTNATGAPITGTITVTPVYTGGSVTCTGTPITFTITINPTPTVNAQANQVVCVGTVTTATFSGAVAGTVYNWTNNNTAIGLGASGTGNISFTSTNAATAPIVGTITVTPTYTNGSVTCSGTPITFTITVNPTPTVNQPANQSLCPGVLTAPVTFTGTVPGTVFNWTNSNTTIGLGASGTGNIPAFTALNPGSTPNVGTITVTPSYTNGAVTCTGTPRTFTITVTPNPAIVIVADPGTTICEGDPTLLTVRDQTGAAAAPVPEILYYKFDGTGNTVPNLASAPPPGSATGTIIGNQTQGGTGQCGTALVGIGGSANANNMNTGWNTNFTGPFTISFWLGANQVDNNPSYLFGNSSAASVFRAFYGGAALTNNMLLRGGSGDILITGVNPAATLVTVVYNGTSTAVYKNGVFFQNYAVTFNTSAAAAFLVGGYNSASLSMTGSLDEFRLYNRALTVGEVAQLTNCASAGAGPISTGTFLWSPALGLSSTTSNPVAASPQNTTTYTVTRTTVPGGCTASANITITVNKRPVVTTQPVSAVRCVGTTATYTVGATGTGLTYQWQLSTAGCAGPWTNLTNGGVYSNVTTATMSAGPVTSAMNGYAYRCIVSGVCAPWIPPTNVSNCVTLTVNPLPVVAITPPISCGGVAGINGTLLSVGSAPPPVPGSVTVNSGTINLAVPDNTANGVSNTIAMAGVPANATITNVTVTLNNFSHTYPGDIIMHLKAPNGQILNLYKYGTGVFTGPASGVPTWGWYGAKVSQLGTTAWSTVATAPFIYNNSTNWKADAINGNVVGAVIQNPTGFVSNATGFADLYTTPASTTGNWTLAMCDGGPGDVGTLASWGITIDYTTPGSGGANNSYVWSPLAGLYNNSTATSPYTGTNTPTVYAAPTVFTVYTVTATDNVTGCVNTASAFVNYTPPAPTVTPSSVTMCLGDPAVRLVSSSSTTTTVTANSGPISVVVPDGTGAPATSSLTVAGVPAGSILSEIKVTLNMSHTWVGDMDINLVAPNNQILNLVGALNGGTGNNGTANFTNTAFSSLGGATISGFAAPRTGTFAAEARAGYGPTGFIQTVNNWTALAPTPTAANGIWRLAMGDYGGGDIGTLTSWSIGVTYVVGVPSTPATWSPIAGLFNDAAATIAYTGTPRDTVWTRPTPAGVYPYQATVQSLPVPPIAFANPAAITINDGAATPYPSNVVVSGLPTTGVTVKNVTISGLSHTWSDDVDILLQSPSGQNVILMSDIGNAGVFNGNTYTFDDAAAAMPATAAAPPSGTYKPTNFVGLIGPEPDNWPAPGPGTVAQPNPTLSTFTGNMNGTWKLFVFDDAAGDQGSISGGFSVGFNLGIAPCTSPARTVIVTVNQPAALNNALPVNQTICTDKVATFTVAVASGTGPFTYQWQVSTNGNNPPWTNVTNGGVYSGATTATLTITAPPVSLSGNFYRCIVTGAAPCASATSFAARLTVNPLPTVVISAAPYTSLFPGLVTTLSSTVSPAAASTYTWLRNGVAVSGATTGTLSVNVDGLGDYQLRVTDVNGCTNSSNIITIKDSASGRCFIYPNPNSGQFQVRYYSVANNVLPRGIVVYDAKGDRVLSQNYTIGRPYDRMDVDMRAKGKGLYWVEIVDRNGNRITMCRVVIE